MISFPITDAARRWLEVTLGERFGHAWRLEPTSGGVRLRLEGSEGGILFDCLSDEFTVANSNLPHTFWYPEKEGWRSVLGGPLPVPGVARIAVPLIERCGADYVIHYDIIGLIYWMLTRVEEVGRLELDAHGRFPGVSSHAYKHGYLDRPVVDEWLHLLGQVIERQWPALVLKQHQFQLRVSHDVDRPSLYTFKPLLQIARMMTGHLIKRHDIKAFFNAPYVKFSARGELAKADPYNTFDWLMDISEEHNIRSVFYFICGRTDPNYDADYTPEHPIIRQLMRRIHQREHEIGLHPSYNTFQSPARLRSEAHTLWKVCADEGIKQAQWGGRMHYLRWRHPVTLNALVEAGLNYDSSLGYADLPGFRCGTSHEYWAFDPVAQNHLNFRIQPLIVMDSCVLNDRLDRLNVSESALEIISALKKRCALVGGVFTLLWHNSTLDEIYLKKLYRSALS